jgi:hypothetical protein
MHRVISHRYGIVSRQVVQKTGGAVAVRSRATGVHPSDCLRSQAKQLIAIGAIELHADLFRLVLISTGCTAGFRKRWSVDRICIPQRPGALLIRSEQHL